MKRSRSVSTDASSSEAASIPLPSRSQECPSSDTDSDTVDFGEDPKRESIVPLFTEALRLMKWRETFADTIRRLAKDSVHLSILTDVHSKILKQQELLLMHMNRDAIVLRALAECTRSGARLTSSWFLRWDSDPSAVHGPFTESEMRQWAASGYFSKKTGEVCDGNTARPRWRRASDEFAGGGGSS